MERCVLHVDVPQDIDGSGVEDIVAYPSYVDIWVLDARLSELSCYSHDPPSAAPTRSYLLTTLVFTHSAASSHSDPFYCPSGEYTTLEFTCAAASSKCMVDFWQNQRSKPRKGECCFSLSLQTGVRSQTLL